MSQISYLYAIFEKIEIELWQKKYDGALWVPGTLRTVL